MTKKLSLAAIALLSLTASAGVAAAAGTTTQQDTFKGDQVVANFSQDIPIDCGDGFIGSDHTGIILLGNELTQRSEFNPQQLDQIEVLVFLRNSCTGEFHFGSAIITDPDFRINAQQRATMSGTVAVTDFFTGESLGTVDFDLLATGVGDVTRSQTHGQFTFGTVDVVQHSVGAFRSAAVTGSITLNGEELIGSFTNGSIGRTRSGNLVIRHK